MGQPETFYCIFFFLLAKLFSKLTLITLITTSWNLRDYFIFYAMNQSTPPPSTMSMKRKSIQPLEDKSILNHPYVAKLQKSTKEVIEESWEEVNRVHKRNSELNHRVEQLEKLLSDKEIKTLKNDGAVESDKQVEKITSPFGTLNDLLSPSFLHKKQKEEKIVTKEDENQLQADQTHKAELEQLAKKVQQQEATIKNLELALALEKSTVQNLKVVHQPKRNIVGLDTCTRLSSFDDPSPKSSKSKLSSSQLTNKKGLQSSETMSIKSLVGRRGSLSSGSALREVLLRDLMGSEVRVLRRKTKSGGSSDFHKRQS